MSRHHSDEEREEDSLPLEDLGTLFPLKIFEGPFQESISKEFNAILLTLDARVQSAMDWSQTLAEAKKAVDFGLRLVWHFDFGLSQGLFYPLWHEGQLRSLTLALQQFQETVWSKFAADSLAAILFKGSLDFSAHFDSSEKMQAGLSSWMREMNQEALAALSLVELQAQEEGRECLRLYCRDLFLEFFSLLSSHLPLSLPRYLFFDVEGLSSSLREEMQLLNLERFENRGIGLRGERLPFKACGWNQAGCLGYSALEPKNLLPCLPPSIGVCVPLTAFCFKRDCIGLEEALSYLLKTNTPFKLLSEAHLTVHWEGLDYLVYSPSALTAQGKRKLQGFSAAGGIAISTAHLLGFPGEMTLQEWISTRQ